MGSDNTMVEIGKYNTLRVVKAVDFGLYLDGGDAGEILLPRRYVPEQCMPGDEVTVFVYCDSEDRIIATTETPKAQVDEFAYLKVVSVNSAIGAFLDWGLPKDLFVPFREQKHQMEKGMSYIVKLCVDRKTNRIFASSKIEQFLDVLPIDFSEGQEVALLIGSKTDLGFKAIINETHWGMLYKNEVFQPLATGQRVQGFIRKIRDDRKIDLTLHKFGYEKVDDFSGKVIKALEAAGGFLPLTDASTPEDIYATFGVSKKTFKKALGSLYKKKVIELQDKGISLL